MHCKMSEGLLVESLRAKGRQMHAPHPWMPAQRGYNRTFCNAPFAKACIYPAKILRNSPHGWCDTANFRDPSVNHCIVAIIDCNNAMIDAVCSAGQNSQFPY